MATDPSPTFLALQGALAGRYALERELGRGGMGVVFLARDISLDRPVAIKLLPPALAEMPALRERFLREARTAARLSHPNIVPIHAVEEHGEFVLFVMGYVEGETLGQRIARLGPLPAEEAARILQEVAWALAYAHRHGVVHRDVKPDNILLERATGRALVSDFGIAQVEHAGVTREGEILGTIRYMSPEQIAGEPIDGRSDLFSLGATGFMALTGRPALEGSAGAMTALARRESVAPVRVLRPELPARLAAIVDRCLEFDPAQRFPDGEALAEALGGARGHQVVISLPVARFVELYKTLATEIASYAAVVVVLAAELLIVRGDWMQAALLATILIWAFFGAVGLGVLRLVQLIRAARRLLDEGYGVADVRRALDLPQADQTGHFAPRGGIRRVAAILGGLLLAGLWVVGFNWQMYLTSVPVLWGLIMALFTLVPVVVVRGAVTRMLRPGKRGWWSRLWWKVLDWKVFRLARLGRGSAGISASQPTEIALGAGARELFEAMPPELRGRFAEVPRVLERLEEQAARLRSETGAVAGERLASTHAALEQLRLELLRLRTGTGSEGDLTADLDAARRITERIEALLDAQRELGTGGGPAGTHGL